MPAYLDEDHTIYAYLDGKEWAKEYLELLDKETTNRMLLALGKERYPKHIKEFMRGVNECLNGKKLN